MADAIPGNRPYKESGAAALVPSVDKKCTQCGLCAEKCPVAAIDPVSFVADEKTCIGCMRCIDICPADARSINQLVVKKVAEAIKEVAEVRKEAELFS